MKNKRYDANRPVHLARQDVFLEKATEVFRACLADAPYKQRAQQIDTTLDCLQSAVEHGTLAANTTQTSPLEAPFLLFIRMVLFDLYSVRVIMENEHALKDRKSPLWQFLNRNGKANEVACFARDGEQLLKDVAHLFDMVEAPFRDIQKTLAEGMNASDRERYQRAYDGLKRHLQTKTRPRVFNPGRIFSPTLEMKYG
ncbi:MAG: hypothetical protein NT011_02090 [Kiritimatiellaeota bacterium]|nr:hypothetical protein [Kiritimatiellota bacterium]